jgi:nicotinate phosphoribosyltransferase
MADRIIRDYDDNDFYKTNMKAFIAHEFPDAEAEFEYIQRDKEKKFRTGFSHELREQFEMMGELRRSQRMEKFYKAKAPWNSSVFYEWERTDLYSPDQLNFEQDNDGRLAGTIRTSWRHGTKWEVPVLATIVELDHTHNGRLGGMSPGWEQKIEEKGRRLYNAGVNFIEFGTRRRAAYAVQDTVIDILRQFGPNFRGTSNPHFAEKYNLTPIGTMAHEIPMAMQALYGANASNERAMHHWRKVFKGSLGIALPDTLTSAVFLRDFDSFYANLFQGVRQDSGDPILFGETFIKHYESLGIDPTTKILVFSDSLNVDKAIKLHEHFKGRIRVTMGIGTHLTNDVGWLAANHVIKLKRINFGKGWKNVYKLSDDVGKIFGADNEIVRLREDLNIAA